MTTTRTDQPPTTAQPDTGLQRRFGAIASITGGISLLTGFLIVPGPDVADVHQAGWVPGHTLHVIGFLLLAIGLPAIAGSMGRRLGVLGLIGYVAVMTRYVLSTGSHLYYLTVLPNLAKHGDLHSQLVEQGRLASIYGGHGDLINAVLGTGMLGLAYAFARCGRGMRTVAVFVALAAVAEFLGTPFGLMLLAVMGVWLGARLAIRGDVLVALRTAR